MNDNPTDRKHLVIKKANTASEKLAFVASALRLLLADPEFVRLLRAEALETIPRPLAERFPTLSWRRR